MQNGLYMHSSNRLESLAKLLAGALGRRQAGDFLSQDLVVVQTPGVARWLSLRLADELGCCMNVRYLFPRNFVDDMCARLLGGEAPAHPDLERMGWRIFALLPGVAAQPGAGVLARYLEGGSPLMRYQLSVRLADLFDQYLVHRPEIIAQWEAGGEPGDWQASLWRELARAEPVRHLASVFPMLEGAQPQQGALPERVYLFGLSTLPQLYVDFLKILSRWVEVRLFALAPSEEFWGDLEGRKASVVAEEVGVGGEFGQPLLSSMGAQGRDFFNLLSDADFNPSGDCFTEPEGDTVLSRVQSELLHLSPLHETSGGVADRSIVVSSSAGPMREVEALKDHLLSLFDDDATLRPRDVLVLAPDITKYAPCVEAVFAGRGAVGPELPFAVADRGARENGPIDAFLRLLELVSTRRTARDILDYLEVRAVRERFGFDEESFAAARKMCVASSVRWGLDEADREELGFGATRANSWRAGMDRLALGVMMSGGGESVFSGIVPFDGAEGGNVEIIARLLAAFDAVRESLRSLEKRRPLSEWREILSRCALSILPEETEGEGRADVLKAIAALGAHAEVAGGDDVDVRTVHAALDAILSDSVAPHGFLSGGITFAELKPMRSVPARVICLLGMDDAAFPRQDRPLSFDRIRRQPRPGDRSVRAGDRYLFLETLLCARERLYISYCGVSPYGEKDTPPSVVVTELMEYLSGGAGAAFPVVRHALQPFSPAYFGEGPLFSYSAADCEAAKSVASPRRPNPFPSGDVMLAPEELLSIDVPSLVEFLLHPSAYYLKYVHNLALPREEKQPEDEEPQRTNGLDVFNEERGYVGLALSGAPIERSLNRMKASGILPWGEAGDAEADVIAANARVFSNVLRPYLTGSATEVAGDFAVGTGEGRILLRAKLGPVIGGRLVSYRCANLKAGDRLGAWVAAVVIGALREDGVAVPEVSHVTTIHHDMRVDISIPGDAKTRLLEFLKLYWEGLARPLPIFPESSFAAAGSLKNTKKPPLERAREAWRPRFRSEYAVPECEDPWTMIAWRGVDPLEARGDEFLELAGRLWAGYADHAEEVKCTP